MVTSKPEALHLTKQAKPRQPACCEPCWVMLCCRTKWARDLLGFGQLEAAEAVLCLCPSTDPGFGASWLTHPGPSLEHRYLCVGSYMKELDFRVALPLCSKWFYWHLGNTLEWWKSSWIFKRLLQSNCAFSEHNAGFIIDLSINGFLPVL